MNLGEEVILTLLWQSGASESATVCFVISYLLLTVQIWSFARRVCVCVCVCVCVWERERERETHRVTSQRSVQPIRNRLNRGLFANTYCSPLGLELMVKLMTLLTVFTLILKAEAGDYGKGRNISDVACGVRPITMHCASWPIRADCACRKEGLCRKRSVWERRGIEDLQ